MQAAILAAGLGTRLRPLTHRTPKALVPVLNRPLLGLWLDRLRQAGFTRVAVNTHHLAQEVAQFLEAYTPSGMAVAVRPEPELLGTGGGLAALGRALEEAPFLAVNVDVLTDLDPAAILQSHPREALVTLVLHHCPPYHRVWLSPGGRVQGIGTEPPEGGSRALAYTGLQVVTPKFVKLLPPAGPFDLVAMWRELLAKGEVLHGLVVTGHFWQDLGTREGYLAAHRALLSQVPPALRPLFPVVENPLLGEGAMVAEGVTFTGAVCLGREVRVGEGAYLKDTVVWEQAAIGPGVRLEGCVVGRGARVTASHQGKLLI